MLTLNPTKAEVRAAARARRDAIPPAEVAAHSTAITAAVCSLPLFAAAPTVCSYLGIGQEIQTVEIINQALASGKRVALPRTVPRGRQLVLHEVTHLHDLCPGPYGILEPSPALPVVDPREVTVFLVPGVAFDTAGNRAGYGGGFYDTLLAQSSGWRIALAHLQQLLPHVPTTTHDMPMHLIVTEAGLVDCGHARQATDHLRLRNMTFYGHHGAFPQERTQGIRLAIDVELRLDLQLSGLTDDLSTTVNYPLVYRLIERIQSEREFALFETLVAQIAAAVLHEFPSVAEVCVRARKFNPPVGGLLDAFEVEITRARTAWDGRATP